MSANDPETEKRKEGDRASLSLAEVEKLILRSGFPFELRVGRELLKMGYDVALGHRVVRDGKDRAADIDVVATKQRAFPLGKGGNIQGILRLGIQCKDTRESLVCFGLRQQVAPDLDTLDQDFRYCSLATTRDRFVDEFALPVFDKKRLGIDVKQLHHQFSRPERFYVVAQVTELHRGLDKARIHAPDALRSVLESLDAFSREVRGEFVGKDPAVIEPVIGGPAIIVSFQLLCHSGSHYEFVADQGKPIESKRTSVLVASAWVTGTKSKSVVDVVSIDALATAISTVESTFGTVLRQITPWVAAARRR